MQNFQNFAVLTGIINKEVVDIIDELKEVNTQLNMENSFFSSQSFVNDAPVDYMSQEELHDDLINQSIKACDLLTQAHEIQQKFIDKVLNDIDAINMCIDKIQMADANIGQLETIEEAYECSQLLEHAEKQITTSISHLQRQTFQQSQTYQGLSESARVVGVKGPYIGENAQQNEQQLKSVNKNDEASWMQARDYLMKKSETTERVPSAIMQLRGFNDRQAQIYIKAKK